MARPSKYQWSKVWADYATGSYDDQQLRAKYKIPRRTYDERKSIDNPKVSAETKHDIEQFCRVSAKTAETITAGGENGDAISEAIDLELRRMGMLDGHFKIVKALQGVIANEIRSGNVDIKNIRNATGALKDMSDATMPRGQGTQVAIQNSQQNNKTIKVIYE